MDQPEWRGQKHTKPIRVKPAEHFREQLTKRIEKDHSSQQSRDEQYRPAAEQIMQAEEPKGNDGDVGQCVADQNGPEKIFRVLQVIIDRKSTRLNSSHRTI